MTKREQLLELLEKYHVSFDIAFELTDELTTFKSQEQEAENE